MGAGPPVAACRRESAGFRVTGSHLKQFNGWGDVTLIDMEEHASHERPGRCAGESAHLVGPQP
jgi:hypothetical protein